MCQQYYQEKSVCDTSIKALEWIWYEQMGTFLPKPRRPMVYLEEWTWKKTLTFKLIFKRSMITTILTAI